MIFVYKKWNSFCKELKNKEILSIPACEVYSNLESFIVLKHDVENSVVRALELAKIENNYGHRGTYYVQAYLLDNNHNVEMLKEIQKLGHEVSYHYDVMDSSKGDLTKATEEFEENKRKFEDYGFPIITVCQHGNPLVERVGYHSNRDFFRSDAIQNKYPQISDIMVNFKINRDIDYTYYSDVGRKFKMIYDPINNDIENSDDKNVLYEDLNALLECITNTDKVIICTHPHRWTSSVIKYQIKNISFKVIKTIAKVVYKIPFMKKIMNKYYYLAKKI